MTCAIISKGRELSAELKNESSRSCIELKNSDRALAYNISGDSSYALYYAKSLDVSHSFL